MGLAGILNRESGATAVVDFKPMLLHDRRISSGPAPRHRDPNRRLKTINQNAIAC
jgi:hypothetical protein